MRSMRCALACLLACFAVLSSSSCRREPPGRRFGLTGQVLAVSADGREITVRHNEVKGFMPAMVMPFTVKDPTQAKRRVPGDLVKATLVVTDDAAWLEGLEKTGWAPFPEPAAARDATAPPLVKEGEAVPDATLIDQNGRPFRVSSLRGAPLLITFIYTRCPLPDFCPRMDRHFQAVQKAIKDGRLPSNTRLLSISFDPDYDTPTVLKDHARLVGADPHVWTFATAPRPQVESFGARLGLDVVHEADTAALTHNLRTAVIDRAGRLVTIFDGNEWTPDQAVTKLKQID